MSASGVTFDQIFHSGPDPDDSDWTLLEPRDEEFFVRLFGPIRLKAEGPARVRCRVRSELRHQNLIGTIHGGYIMALVDQVLFLCPHALGIKGGAGGATLDTSTQFFAPLVPEKPIDAVVDVLRETNRLIFMRGLIEQDGQPAVAFSGTIRKSSAG
ncbi:PaaI family thioesterase [Rhizorhapis sp. SPR117]|uniref:PaaI family thioesterase n=1 Tax=Rhizorhapis sp. SPR117 TaxID=2912611 RepID=UPI001F473C58|nr:PaaI family thioesterase [Rhizorhapis sp. SPR117]